MVESTLLGLLAGAGGLVFALFAIRALKTFGPHDIPRFGNMRIDPAVMLFTAGVSLAAGVMCGLAPSMDKGSYDTLSDLRRRQSWKFDGTTRHSARSALIILELALAMILITGAGLLIRSFMRVQSVNLGYQPERMLTMRVDLPGWYSGSFPRADEFFEQALQRVRAIKGVRDAAATDTAFSDYVPNDLVTLEGSGPLPGEYTEECTPTTISEGYFETMGIPLLAGRDISSRDSPESVPVAIINQTMAQHFWPGVNPVGRRFRFGVPGEAPRSWWTVVGVVADSLPNGPEGRVTSRFFLPSSQRPWVGSMAILVRTISDPSPLAATVRATIMSVQKGIPRFEITTVERQLGEIELRRIFQTWLLGLFSVIAVVLAMIGIYGVMSYSVQWRTHEIGVRMALGAQRNDVLQMIVSDGLRLAVIGIGIGIAGGLALTRFLSSMLFGVKPADPLTFAVVVALLFGVALVACYVPARRATKVDPMVALRYE